jgi:hypothetical protein
MWYLVRLLCEFVLRLGELGWADGLGGRERAFEYWQFLRLRLVLPLSTPLFAGAVCGVAEAGLAGPRWVGSCFVQGFSVVEVSELVYSGCGEPVTWQGG